MTRKSRFLARAGSLLAVLGAASASAAAVEAHRAPKARDLETLGISPAAFKTIGQ
jgi:hypothetical protein